MPVFRHRPGVSCKACFSEDRLFRYLLEITADSTGKKLCVIMQNPSDADEHVSDKSIQFLETLFFEKCPPEIGPIGIITVVNLYALVQKHDFHGGEKAVGTYYNGSNLSGINKKYASDSNWANAVYSHMKYLYNKL